MHTLKQISRALFCSLLLSSAAIIAQNNNNLVVFSETGERFYLILNGLKYNQKPETNVKVTNLNATNYKAKILFENGHPDLDHNVYLMWEGNAVTNKEFTYAVSKKGDKYKLKFISQADMGGVNPNSANSVVYNSNGTLFGTNTVTGVNTTNEVGTNVNTNSTQVSTGVSGGGYNSSTTVTTTTTTTGAGGANGSVGMNVNVDGVNMSINVIGTPTAAVLNTNTVTTTTTTYSSSSTSSNTGGGAVQTSNNTSTSSAGGCSGAMSADDFDDLKKSIEGKSFEDVKMTVLKQAVAANCVNTAQVRKLMDLFSFEANKLDVTKYCYDFTTDKKNYYKVNDGFTFSGSVEELNTYIKGKK